MKVINIQGTHHTGKTTVAAAVISELCNRGYSVGSVKSIHFDAFTMETEGSNTDTHKKSGADPVTALSGNETNIMFKGKLDLAKVLGFYDNDWVVIEGHVADKGVSEVVCPNISVGKTAEDWDDQINELTIAFSGIAANDHADGDVYKFKPVFDIRTEAKELVDLIEEITPEYR